MSNLGLYQEIVKIAKKVGGPANFIALLVGGGFALGIGTTKVVEKLFLRHPKRNRTISRKYKVKKHGISNEGLELNEGDFFHVLERDKDAVVIELIGSVDNPYVVSYDLLTEISDYE